MNQFRLDLDATRCAQAHQDAHCGKMLLELVQQLCTAFPVPDYVVYRHLTWLDATPEQRIAADLLPYARTKAQYSNPVCVWTRATRANFDSTIELAQALAIEFRHRFGKPHGSEAALDWVVRHRAEAQVPDGPLTPYALAMPEEYQYSEQDRKYLIALATCTVLDPCVAAYRAYYRAEKRGYWRKSRNPAKPSTWVPATWTRRDPPEWF